MRILPRTNDDVNEEWISDKTRHVVDGLRTQRLDQPYIRENGRLRPATWREAFAAIAARVKTAASTSIGAIAGDLAAAEDMYALKDLLTRLGNSTIAGIEQADALLIVGANPRREAAVLNARIRKRWRARNFPIALIGEKADLTYSCDYLGAGAETLANLGKTKFGEAFQIAEHPLVILGAGAVARPDGAAVLSLAAKTALDFGALK